MSDKATETKAPAVLYRYVGDGSYLQGVPMRDLTEADDFGERGEEIEASGLYKKEGDS